MTDQKAKPIFEKRIFWDVNFESLDYDVRHNLSLKEYLIGET